jgi:hypothetical protein
METEILVLCPPCHKRLDSYFDRFIKWGNFHIVNGLYDNENLEAKKKWRKEYYQKNRERRLAYQKEWNKRNKRRRKETRKRYRDKNRKRLNEYTQAYYQYWMYGKRNLVDDYEKKYGTKVKLDRQSRTQAYFDLLETRQYVEEDCYPLIPRVVSNERQIGQNNIRA